MPLSALSHKPLAGRARSIGLSLLFALLAVVLLMVGKRLIAGNADSAAIVDAAPPLPVHTGSLDLEPGHVVPEPYVGRIEPHRQTELGFEAGGTLAAILVDEGGKVEQGELIARLDRRALHARRQEQQALHAALAAQLELAELTRERQHEPARRNLSTAQQYDESRLRAEELGAQTLQSEAVLAGLDIELDKSDIRAPYRGAIGARHMDEGASVAPGAAFVRLLEDSSPLVRIDVSPAAARSLAATNSHVIESQGRHFEATPDRLRPDIDPATWTLTAVFRIRTESGMEPETGHGAEDTNNSGGGLSVPFSEIARIVIAHEIPEAGVWVSVSALTEGERGLWSLYVLDESVDPPIVHRESIEVLYANAQSAFVRGSFIDGASYIDTGTHRVTTGQRVRDIEDAREPGPLQREPL